MISKAVHLCFKDYDLLMNDQPVICCEEITVKRDSVKMVPAATETCCSSNWYV